MTMTNDTSLLPPEIREIFERHVDNGGEEPSHVAFYAKSEKARGDAWAELVAETKEGNPWRKCHTKDYWVWYMTAETAEQAKRHFDRVTGEADGRAGRATEAR